VGKRAAPQQLKAGPARRVRRRPAVGRGRSDGGRLLGQVRQLRATVAAQRREMAAMRRRLVKTRQQAVAQRAAQEERTAQLKVCVRARACVCAYACACECVAVRETTNTDTDTDSQTDGHGGGSAHLKFGVRGVRWGRRRGTLSEGRSAISACRHRS
jgi:hypothetical protein